MIDFVDKLQKDFDIELIQSTRDIRGENTFNLDKKGNIRKLSIYETNLNTLDILLPIAESLVELTIRDGNIERLIALKHFSKIEKLNLSFNPLLEEDISNINYLEKIKILDLSATDIKNTHLLKNLINVEELYLGTNPDIEEIKGLEKLEKLKIIDLQSSSISNINDIYLSDNVYSINLKGTEIKEITGLDRFPNLVSLNLGGNRIVKIQGLDFLGKLKKLNLSSCWIEKIEGLTNLSNLEVLDLSNQEIEKIEGLEELVKLKELNLSENKLTKVENLDSLTQLEYLLLDCNSIDYFDTNFLQHLRRHPCLISLCHNPIQEMDAVPIPKNIEIKFKASNYLPRTLF
ncbi:MAG: leucine-rich repeat domain-containing protein [Aureispira sp.]